MSGFAAIFHLDGAPVDRAWLEAMADFLSFRGPDGREVWVSGSAGMCHTLLRTSAKSDGTAQIPHRDQRLWITGQIRIDDRDTLIAKFPPESGNLQNASSAELVLLAYERWGEACVEHLIGDFSFVIWDAGRRRVFAARDQFGVRPLFYSRTGPYLLISNTLDCIRQIPVVSGEWNERAIGDFLLLGLNKDPSGTFYSAIQRVRPAHRLLAGSGGLKTERYWSLPIDEPLYYKRSLDYVERFHELFSGAVQDRLPDGPLGVFMSGGLDSPALAAFAVRLGASVTAFTSVYDRLIPDQERHYAGLAAEYLRIPIAYNARDDEPWGWEPGSDLVYSPEPVNIPVYIEAYRRYFCGLSTQARVFFWGDRPDDALLYEWRGHFRYLASQHRWGRLCRDLALHAAAFKRVPLLPTLARIWKEKNDPDRYGQPGFPKWINADFEARLQLRQRWEELLKEEPSPHPIRKDAYASLASDFPISMAWNEDNGGCPGDPAADHLHPFVDVRLIRFLLAVPAVPWCREKYLIRTSLKGVLPEAVRLRPKSPLSRLPYVVRARRSAKPVLPSVPVLAQYVDIQQLPEWPGHTREETDDAMKVLGLHYWLASR